MIKNNNKHRLLPALLAFTLSAGLMAAPLAAFADTESSSSASSSSASTQTLNVTAAEKGGSSAGLTVNTANPGKTGDSASSLDTDPQVKASHYTINASLNTKSKTLTETVTMHVVNNSSRTISQLCIVNIADGYLKFDRKNYSADVKKSAQTIVQNISLGGQALSYKKGSDASDLYVDLGDKKLSQGDSADVTVRVKTSVPKREDRFGYTNLAHGKRLYNLSFCFPYLSDYRHGKWITHPYYDDGENRNSAVTDYDVSFRAPSDYVVAATGKSNTKDGVTTIHAEKVRDMGICLSNAYKKQSYKINGITVNNYYFPNKYRKTKYMTLYNKVCKMVAQDSIDQYTKNIGAYPYDELDMMECLFGVGFGGMEYPGLIMINGSSEYQAKKQIMCDFYAIQDDVSHEIGHQWFYAAVGNDEYNEAWLDEGFASFLEDGTYGMSGAPSTSYVDRLENRPGQTAKLRKYYKQDTIKEMHAQLKKNKKTYINIPVNKFPKDEPSSMVPYDYGGNFLRYLYVTMGPQKFYSALQEYYSTYCLKQATTQDFIKIILKYDRSSKVKSIIKLFIK
jgi:hypothetical protein